MLFRSENQPWFRQINDEDGSGCSVWQAFKPLETGSNFTKIGRASCRERDNIKHVKDDCIVEYITGNKMNKVPKCENQPWFRQISDEDGSGCSVWQAFKPLETGSNFTTELEWAGDLEDLAKSQHTIARYIRSLAKPDETLFETAIRLS